ncbi:ecdysteroid kinase domain-containing protein [Phthorimaea operculella]|nr:ecdysteroid kinase domain-containing protein [Phthorimaea operculella]
MADAESILRGLIAEIASEHDFNDYKLVIKPVNSGGANFTSALFLVTVKCPGKKDVELFAKVAIMSEQMREAMGGKKMYDLEVFFYTKLSKIYRSLELKAKVTAENRLVIPKFYGSKTDSYEETLILQNLTAEGFKLHNRRVPVSWEYAASAIENLAKFHALSFAYQKENPEEFEEICKDLVSAEIAQNETLKDSWNKQKEGVLEIIKNTEYKSRVAKVLNDQDVFAVWNMIKRPLDTKVIVHGDFRPDNMMYREKVTGQELRKQSFASRICCLSREIETVKDKEVEVIVLDYQTMFVGCPASDLVYFIACGTDSAFRVKYHERLMNHYYQELSAAMQRLGVDPAKAYSRKQFDSELKQMMPNFLMLSITMLRIVLVDAENAPKTDGEGGIENFMGLKASGAFAERFNGVVEDCARWGLI